MDTTIGRNMATTDENGRRLEAGESPAGGGRSLLVEFRLGTPLLGDTARHVPEMTIEVEQEVALDTTETLLTVTAVGSAFGAFERALAADGTVLSTERLGIEGDDERRYLLSVAREYSLYWDRIETNAVLLAARRRPEDWLVRLCLPDRTALARLCGRCREREWRFDLVRLTRTTGTEGGLPDGNRLTDKQRAFLERALEAGYFDVPRRTTLDELAAEFAISDQAASERLRRGIANSLADVLGRSSLR